MALLQEAMAQESLGMGWGGLGGLTATSMCALSQLFAARGADLIPLGRATQWRSAGVLHNDGVLSQQQRRHRHPCQCGREGMVEPARPHEDSGLRVRDK